MALTREQRRNRAIATVAARTYHIPVPIFLAQMGQEAGFRTHAVSYAGARGPAQFMPATARSMGVNPNDPRSAYMGAARMDARNFAKYHNWRDVLSLYNSGRGWEQGQRIGQTRNYVRAILSRAGSGAVSNAVTVPAPPLSQQMPASPDHSSRKALALALIQASQQTHSGQTPDYGGLYAALAAAKQQREAPPPATPGSLVPSMPAASSGKRGGISELIYAPFGEIKNGRRIPLSAELAAGHRDHVHFATMSPQKMLAAIAEARRLGLHVSENPFVGAVHPVHVEHSNHYRVIGSYRGRRIGGAIDSGGTPAQMAAFARWVARNI